MRLTAAILCFFVFLTTSYQTAERAFGSQPNVTPPPSVQEVVMTSETLDVGAGQSVTLCGVQSFTASINVHDGGIVYVTPSDPAIPNSGTLLLSAPVINIGAGSAIHGDGVASYGAGAGQSSQYGSGGGGHGGAGGAGGAYYSNGTPILVGGPGGSATGQVDSGSEVGSSGGRIPLGTSYRPGGSGGGSVALVGRTVSIAGTVTANGADGLNGIPSSPAGTGGGSGGSINIDAAELILSGTLSACGGDGGSFYGTGLLPEGSGGGGGGAGGRIRLHCATLTNTGSTLVQGGAGGLGYIGLSGGFPQLPVYYAARNGENGTVYSARSNAIYNGDFASGDLGPEWAWDGAGPGTLSWEITDWQGHQNALLLAGASPQGKLSYGQVRQAMCIPAGANPSISFDFLIKSDSFDGERDPDIVFPCQVILTYLDNTDTSRQRSWFFYSTLSSSMPEAELVTAGVWHTRTYDLSSLNAKTITGLTLRASGYSFETYVDNIRVEALAQNETTPPLECAVTINEGATYTNNPNVSVEVIGSDGPTIDGLVEPEPEDVGTGEAFAQGFVATGGAITGAAIRPVQPGTYTVSLRAIPRGEDISSFEVAADGGVVRGDFCPPVNVRPGSQCYLVISGGGRTFDHYVVSNGPIASGGALIYRQIDDHWQDLSNKAADLVCAIYSEPIRAELSNDGARWDQVSLSESTPWTLLMNPDGEKTVTARLRDLAGNMATVSATIILDTTSPKTTAQVTSGEAKPAGDNLIVNGRFDSSLSGWSASNASVDTSAHHSAPGSARLYSTSSASIMQQDIAIPQAASNVMLSFWTAAEVQSSDGHVSVEITDLDTSVTETLLFRRAGTYGWSQQIFPLDGHAGHTIRLTFAAVGCFYIFQWPSTLWVDDVFLTIDSGLFVPSSDAAVTLAATDELSGVAQTRHRWNNEAEQTYTGPISVSGLAEGIHCLRYRSTDMAGNAEIERALWLAIDSTAPYAISVDPPDGALRSAVPNITAVLADAVSGIDFSASGISLTLGGAPVSGSISHTWPDRLTFTPSAPLSSGTYSYTITATDAAGNAMQPYSGTFTIDTSPPTTPVVVDPGLFLTEGTDLVVSWRASDDESGIAGYQYALGTAPGESDIAGWTSTDSNSASLSWDLLTNGQACYVSVKARNGAMVWSDVGASDGIILARGVSGISEAKLLPDDPVVLIANGLVAAKFANCAYVQDGNRVSGIRVDAVPAEWSEGCRVTFGGAMGVDVNTGERLITHLGTESIEAGASPSPLGIRNSAVGGSPFGSRISGVPGSSGLHNTGLLVTVWGKVKYRLTDRFYVDDGSGVNDGSGFTGLCVYTGSLAEPPLNASVRVTGISTLQFLDPGVGPMIRPRRQEDIQVIAIP